MLSLISQTVGLVPMTSILEWINTTAADTKSALINVGAVIAVLVVIIGAASSRGAIGKILIAAGAAGLIVWGVSAAPDVATMFRDTIK